MARSVYRKKLILGELYNVITDCRDGRIVSSTLKFIKTTPKGYNFLNEKTNKVVFKAHFYPLKNQDTTKDKIGITYAIPYQLRIF